MKRISAAVAAVALIVIAIVVRRGHEEEAKLGPYRLTCATEFADVCRSVATTDVAVTVEPATTTADRVAAAAAPAGAAVDLGFDGWLSSAGFAAGGDTKVLGHSRLAVVGWRERINALRQACGGTLSWRCLGDASARRTWKANAGQESWGLVKIVVPDPATEAAGLVALATMTLGFDPKLTLSTAVLSQADDYQRWLRGVANATVQPAPTIESILAAGPAVADIYVGIDADVTPVVQSSARRNDVEVVYLAPVFDIEAQLVTTNRKPPSRLTDALRTAGWTERAAENTVALPPGVGSLRDVWREALR
jgi:hypothetical protein